MRKNATQSKISQLQRNKKCSFLLRSKKNAHVELPIADIPFFPGSILINWEEETGPSSRNRARKKRIYVSLRKKYCAFIKNIRL